MRLLPCGTTALLIELDSLEDVLAMHASLVENCPQGVVDLVPAARTVLVVADRSRTSLAALAQALHSLRPRIGKRPPGELVQIPVRYDGADLGEVAALLRCAAADVVRRHTAQEWTVAFCGFAPGFAYLTQSGSAWDVPRRSAPRVSVPAGAVALAGEFSGVYPRASPGGWQLIGSTALTVFDLARTPPALLRPGTRVRFVEVGAR